MTRPSLLFSTFSELGASGMVESVEPDRSEAGMGVPEGEEGFSPVPDDVPPGLVGSFPVFLVLSPSGMAGLDLSGRLRDLFSGF